MTKEEILAKLTARQRQISDGLSITQYHTRTIEALHEVAAELLADKLPVEEVTYEYKTEIDIATMDIVAFIIMGIFAIMLVIAGYEYYALTLFVLFLIVYLIIKGFTSWWS